MITGLSHAHSGFRWIILVLLIATVVRAFLNRKNSDFGVQAKLGLFTMIAMHIQLLVGFGLYMSGQWKAVSKMDTKKIYIVTRYYKYTFIKWD